jgi:membrane-bound lytic murein transglycosylase D
MHSRGTSVRTLLATLTTLVVALSAAHGQPGATVHPGPSDPPGPAQPAEDAPRAVREGRQAVRGCPPEEPACFDAALRDLVEFERETFPRRPSDSPWRDHDELSPPPPSRPATRPSQLGAEYAWMDDLEVGDLPVRWDLRVVKFIQYYAKDPRGQRLMREWLRAQGTYRDLILSELRAAKLPEDLLYVAMIESSYDSRERSRVGASGLWQFMPAGGRIYGLEQDRWVDERNDPVKATRAVTQYWLDLYARFGNWDLSLAAFNAGYGAVIKGIAKYNTNDFWRLLEHENALPWESSYYVPKALACAVVGHNRDRLGFGDVEPAPAMSYDTVTVPASTTLAGIARAAGVSVADLGRLNPQLRQARTPPGRKDFVVRVPRGGGARYAENVAQLRGEWDGFTAYVMRHGERFEDVATTHGIARGKLRELNGIASESELSGGTVLVVPQVSEDAKRANLTAAEESLYASGVPEGAPGDKLLVALPDPSLVVAGKRRVFYRVVTGDSLYAVARAFAVDRHQMASWNGLDAETHLHPRMVLQVWVAPGFDPAAAGVALLDERRLELVQTGSAAHLDTAERRMGRERITYTATRRESYEDIGKKFGLTARDLARINKLPFDTVVEPGGTCIVYKVIDRTGSDRAAAQARAAAPPPRPKSRGKAADSKAAGSKAAGGKAAGGKAAGKPGPRDRKR